MLNFKKIGNGNKCIFFIHGNSQSAASWSGVAESLAKDPELQLVLIDLPGHGESVRSKDPLNDYSLIHVAQQVKQFIVDFESTNYIVVALSLGSNILGEIVHELKNCRGAILVGSCIVGKLAPVEAVFLPNPNSAGSFISEPSELELDLLINDACFQLSEETKMNVKKTFRATDPSFRLALADSITNQKYTDEIANFQSSHIPLAIVFGKEEKNCRIDYLDKVPFNKWCDETILIPESGHLCNVDQPKKLAQVIKEFATEYLK